MIKLTTGHKPNTGAPKSQGGRVIIGTLAKQTIIDREDSLLDSGKI